MMNLFKLSETLKDFSKDQLVREMQAPSGSVPQYLVMSELQRRTRMEKEAATAEPPSQTTVAQDTVTAAGMPQGGVAQMAQALAPKTDMAANTGIAAMAPQAAPTQRMQEGGVVRMQAGTAVGPNTTTYQDWLGMSRTERERAGLPTSTIGGQLYFNRFGVGLGRNDPETGVRRVDPELRDARMEDAALGLGVDGEFATPPTGEGIGLRDMGRWAVGGIPVRLREIGEGLGFGPAMERAGIESSDEARERILAERAAADLRGGRARYEPEPASVPVSGQPDLLDDMSDAVTPPAPAEEPAGEAGGPGGAGDLFGGLDSDYETDKWLALARFGLGLMSSREPTLGGAIGEAGAGALDSLSAARESFRDRQLQQAELDLARQRLALEAAGGDSRGIGDRDLLGAYREQLGNIDEQLADLSTYMVGEEAPPAIAQEHLRLTNQRARVAEALTALGASGFGPATQRLVETDLTQ